MTDSQDSCFEFLQRSLVELCHRLSLNSIAVIGEVSVVKALRNSELGKAHLSCKGFSVFGIRKILQRNCLGWEDFWFCNSQLNQNTDHNRPFFFKIHGMGIVFQEEAFVNMGFWKSDSIGAIMIVRLYFQTKWEEFKYMVNDEPEIPEQHT
tara:strand:+ start:345 stop:797 length:453 start_codon:yes stop_codon:yes gene_type:complete